MSHLSHDHWTSLTVDAETAVDEDYVAAAVDVAGDVVVGIAAVADEDDIAVAD